MFRPLRRIVIRCAVYAGLVRLRRVFTKRRHVILVFHRLRGDGEAPDAFDSCPCHDVAVFRQVLSYLRGRFHVVSLPELVARREERAPLAAVTFDDGWRDTYTLAFPILRELGIPATVFVTTGKIGSSVPFWQQSLGQLFRRAGAEPGGSLEEQLRSAIPLPPKLPLAPRIYRQTVARWKGLSAAEIDDRLAQAGWVPTSISGDGRCFLSAEEIRSMAQHGISFGSHTVTHAILPKQRPDVLVRELDESAKQLDALLGYHVDTIAYPNGEWSNEVLHCARSMGYRRGCTTRNTWTSAHDDPLKLPRIELPWDGPAGRVAIAPCIMAWHLS